MHRTQIYIGRASHRRLRSLAARRKTTISHLIREAVDGLVAKAETGGADAILDRVAGIWADRPAAEIDVRKSRAGWGKRSKGITRR